MNYNHDTFAALAEHLGDKLGENGFGVPGKISATPNKLSRRDVWPDCPLCGANPCDGCDCDPDDAQKALLRRPIIIVAELSAVRARLACASAEPDEALWESLNDASERLTDELDAAIRERLGVEPELLVRALS